MTVTAEPEEAETTTPSAAASPDEGWQERIIRQLGPGVVRLQVVGCEGESMGTGFVVGTDLVATAAHVAADAATITVKAGDQLLSADVVGTDPASDTALLRTRGSLRAPTLRVDEEDPAQGRDVLVLGYPLSVWGLRSTVGGIRSSEQVEVAYEGQTVFPLIETDAEINGGNSGGPVLDRDGAVVALVSGSQEYDDSGAPVDAVNYLVPASSIAPRLEEWRDAPSLPARTCDSDVQAPAGDALLQVDLQTDDPAARAAAQTLFTHGESINNGSYETAWALFTPAAQDRHPFAEWSASLDTSYWTELDVLEVTAGAEDALTLRTRLSTEQDDTTREDGLTCTTLSLDYRMALAGTTWLVDGVEEYDDVVDCSD